MHRVLLVALLFPAVAAAQGVDEWIDLALDPRIAPEQRVEALKKVSQAKEGLDRLAEKGLDPRHDPEVVHAVVDTLLKAADYKPYVGRMCRLILSEGHRDKVLNRFQRLWEADRGLPLLEQCLALARDPDAQLREAAILALGTIPRRRAMEAIVEAGLAATEEPVRAAARTYVQLWLGVASLRDAAERLQERKLDSFHDLVRERIEALNRENAEHELAYARFLAKASAAEALDELEKGGRYRLHAARRIAKLAEQNGIDDKVEFARRVFDGLVAELAREPAEPAVLTQLVLALQPFARDAEGPLFKMRKPEEVRDTIQKLAAVPGSGPEHQQLGALSMRLLTASDDKGHALFAFAEKFPAVDVRKEAIQQLGRLAHRIRERSYHVAIWLTNLLAVEKDPAIRAQILNLLTQAHLPVVREPDEVLVVRGFLEKAATPELTDAELRDCAFILGKAQTPEAKDALLAVASGHAKLAARQSALEGGLVPWARKDETIHAELVRIATAPEQSLDARRTVIEALGRKGGRRSAKTLREIEEAKDVELPPGSVREAKLVLLERLANGKGAAADAPAEKPADLEVAVQLLEEVIDADPERLELIATALVKSCEAAEVPAGTARYRLAWLYGRFPPEKMKEEELRLRYEVAAENAEADRLPAALRAEMLEEYRVLLLKNPTDPRRMQDAAICAEKLGDLALEEKNKEKAAVAYFDAAEYYFGLGNRQRAKELLDKATATGGVAGDLVSREKQLRAKLG